MSQDTPFSGGLGSYKLYVLVATHIAKHLELGGNDDPADVLLCFLFRYGQGVGPKNACKKARTILDKDDIVDCDDGGKADLSNVFLLEECRTLFGQVWIRLRECLRKPKKPRGSRTPNQSFLVEVIHTALLAQKRQRNIANAEKFIKRYKKDCATDAMVKSKGKTGASAQPVMHRKRDLTEAELVAGYGGRKAKKNRYTFTV